MEGESYASESDGNPASGFITVHAGDTNVDFLGTLILATNTTASRKGALLEATGGAHADKVTYNVQFASTGTYYFYMRFSMFESGVGLLNYLSEDSFFVPPDFGKDPQTDWPLTDPANGRNGGYTEGCCDASGWLYILEYGGNGSRTNRNADTNYWEGNFHWNQLLSSQFLTSGLSGEKNTPHKYEVTSTNVGVPLTFTVSLREKGTCVDMFLFSTHTNLLNDYTQEELDQLFVNQRPRLTINLAGTDALLSWPVSAVGFVLESTSTLSPPSWVPVTPPAPVVVSNRNTVTVAATGTQFYRLRQP
jgi:hypothetical protein